MKHVIIITNKPKDPGLETTEEICSILEAAGVTCSVYADEISAEDIAEAEGAGKEGAAQSRPAEHPSGESWRRVLEREGKGTDAILVLGGDGTLLRTARNTAKSKLPVLGINLGTLGYLAEVEKSSLRPAMEKLLAGDYTIEERMMLQGQVWRKGAVIEDTCSLNDVTITRNGPLQMLFFQIFVNGKLLKEYHADGIIVATPTGSTGYNMSAGGPIVEPGASILLLTPICAHTLQTRSVVLRAEDEIVIRVRERDGYVTPHMEVNFDGSRSVALLPGDEVHIARSALTTSIIKLSEASFLDVLHRKMSE